MGCILSDLGLMTLDEGELHFALSELETPAADVITETFLPDADFYQPGQDFFGLEISAATPTKADPGSPLEWLCGKILQEWP